ncbi:putative MFS family arabinose efflux permease [Ilumatobacter fluminis]|uniref:Putative MFS family arabinose efflux permease n=1 Tax=Ilumatobacter fluminis TaxID=467091 RepID=A0A4R7I6L4_9ACTN|nr:MFS transporter [Ilumatobacter fluminis]TDT18699.1 putative MFS family arabinose efflux permease [Ilumatobacter fluminis]
MTTPTAARADETASSFSALLRDRVFAPFFFANSLSNTGNWFQNVAAGIVVYDLTGSNTAVGAVSIVQFIATMLLTPWMGALTDRVNRRHMLLAGQSIAFAGASALAVTVIVVGIDGLPGPWPIYAATAVIGLGAATILPSLQAVVPSLVERRDLDRAIALNSMTFNIARSIGPIAAGATVAALGAEWAFGINALTFVPLLVVLLVIRPRGEVEPDDDSSADVREGVRWILDRREVIAVLAATLIVGWTSDPFSTLMPALAESLGGGDATVGLLVGSFGLGAALTAPWFDRVKARVDRERIVPVALVISSVGLATVALAPVTPIALAGAAVSGSGFLLGVTGTNSELQKAMPEHLRGRVMAWWSVAFLGCRPIAAVVDGAIADLTDVRVAIGVSAAVALTGAVFGLTRTLATKAD